MITQICKFSGKTFVITDADQAYYEKMNVPLPTLCPEERLRMRMLRRNVWKFYKRNCNGTGKPLISLHHPDAVNPVYHVDYWYSDNWDGMDLGYDYDFSKGFWENFESLLKKVPLPHMNVLGMENSEYSNEAAYTKNSYLTFYCGRSENCLYSYEINSCKNCCDCYAVRDCELCYEILDGGPCYEVLFSELVRYCNSSWYLFDCRNCTKCIACVGLSGKKFHVLNQEVSEDRFNEVLSHLKKENTLPEDMAREYEKLKMKHPRCYLIGSKNENVSGNYIYKSKNISNSFYLHNCQDCTYCLRLLHGKDCYDIFQWGDPIELGYFSVDVGDGVYNVKFSDSIYGGADIEYSFLLQHCHNCFMSAGLRHKQHCILNKQYSKEEYEDLKSRIIEAMKKEGIYGDFFPPHLSPFCYNESPAQEYYPETREGVARFNGRWREALDEKVIPEGTKVLEGSQVPDVIPDDICSYTILCAETGRPFRYIQQEVDFYKNMSLKLPKIHPEERIRKHGLKMNPFKLWDRQCAKCQKAIQTSYAPERPEIVCCEECYIHEIH